MKKTLMAVVLTLCLLLSLALVACQEQVTLTLYDNDGTTVLNTIKVNKGTAPTKPTDPAKDGMTFKGWFITPTNAKEFDFTASLNEDAKAYAQWQTANYQDDRDWVLVGTMNGWSAERASHFTKVDNKGNEYTLTIDIDVDDAFKCTVLNSDGTLDYNNATGANVGYGLLKDGAPNFTSAASLGEASANISCAVSGNYTFTLTTDPVNSSNRLTVVRNGDRTPVEEVETVAYYIKGKNITNWQDVHTNATIFMEVEQKLTLTVYLKEADEVMFTQYKTKGDVSNQGLTYNVTNLDAASAELFDGTHNLVIKTAGYYTFTLDPEAKVITATLDTETQRDEWVCFIDGDILGGKYGDYQKSENESKYKMTKSGEVYTIEGVELNADEQLIVRTYKASETEYTWTNMAKTYNAQYLHGSVGFGPAAKDNQNIKVGESGTYTITFDSYTQIVTIAKSGKDVYIKGEKINAWDHKFNADYKFTVTDDEAVYELTITLEEGAAFGLAVYNIGESSGAGGWVGRDQLGTDGTANSMFGESGNLTCQTAGTYRLTYNYKTNVINIYTVTAE